MIVQLRAVVTKSLIEKRRSLRVTAWEFLSHLLIITLLVICHQLAVRVPYEDRDYSRMDIKVPPTMTDAMNAMEGPLPAMTLGEYVAMSRSIQEANFDKSLLLLGRKYDNIMRLGTIHFSPENKLTRSLVIFLRSTYTELRAVSFRYHVDEKSALKYINSNLRRRTLALVVLNSVTSTDVRYKIRMNYTSLPNTNMMVNPFAVGLGTDYQLYMSSGFLSLKDAIDKWIFGYVYTNSTMQFIHTATGNGNNNVDSSKSKRKKSSVSDSSTSTTTHTGNNSASISTSSSTSISTSTSSTSSSSIGPHVTISTPCARPGRVYYTPFPVPAYDQNSFYLSISYALGLALTMSTLYPVSRLVKAMVEEKETRMEEVMKIMGLNRYINNAGWAISAAITFAWVAVTSAVVAKFTFLPNSDISLLVTFFLVFTMSEIPFCFLMSTFFRSAKIASIAAPVALFVAMLPRFVFLVTNMYEEAGKKYLVSLFSPTAFAFGADMIAAFEYTETGVQWYNAYEGDYSFMSSLSMMVVDTVLYTVLAWYLGEVLPGEYGSNRGPLFFMRYEYWCTAFCCVYNARCFSCHSLCSPDGTNGMGCCSNCKVRRNELVFRYASMTQDMIRFAELPVSRAELVGIPEMPVLEMEAMIRVSRRDPATTEAQLKQISDSKQSTFSDSQHDNYETLPTTDAVRSRVFVCGLRKEYGDGKVAVSGVNFAMVEGQITCLLGHNGAGKSTLISMLTGLCTPTAGDAVIYDFRVASQITSARTQIGVCPQQNVLFPSLTVREHLAFFGNVKGFYGSALDARIQQMVDEVGLTDKIDTRSESLSGGMKRKLCLAIALIGDPKFVLLDEPTSGMDPYSRRSTWELLQKIKADRVILLTTHFMDEADILGDRVVILSEGQVQCSGSPLYLKNRFGAGYVLTISLSGSRGYNDANKATAVLAESKETIMGIVQKVVPLAVIKSTIAQELEIQLPLSAVGHFGELFAVVQQNTKKLGISGYGVSISTLEQVFIAVANQDPNKASAAELTRYVKRRISKLLELAVALLNKLTVSNQSAVAPSPSITTLDAPVQSQPNNICYQFKWQFVIAFINSLTTRGTTAAVGAEETTASQIETYTRADAIPNHSLISMSNPTRVQPDVPTLEMPHNKELRNNDEESALAPHPKRVQRRGRLRAIFGSNVSSQTDGVNSKSEGPTDADTTPVAKKFTESLNKCWHRVFIQFIELMRKRLIIQSRDLNGFFFQIIVPALQVFAILSILTVSINPSGQPIVMDATAFDSVPTTYYAESAEMYPGSASVLNASRTSAQGSSFYMPRAYPHDILSPRRHFIEPSGTHSSSELTTFLFNLLSNKGGADGSEARLASYSFADTIKMNVDIDWTWVKNNLKGIMSFHDNMDDYMFKSIKSTGLNVIQLESNDLETFNISFPSVSEEVVTQIDTVTRTQGVVLPSFLLKAIQTVTETITSQFITTITIINLQYTLTFDGLSYDKEKNELTLLDVIVTAEPGSIEYKAGDIPLALDTAKTYLPSYRAIYKLLMDTSVTIMHNTTSPHAIAAFDGELISSLFSTCANMAQTPTNGTYQVVNDPLPLTTSESLEMQIVLSIVATLLILIPLSYLPASFVSFIVKERTCKAKHMQIVSSVSPYTYWTANLLFDQLLYLILVGFLFATLLIYGEDAAKVFVSGKDTKLAMFFVLLSYGLSIVPLCYLYSMLFDNHSTAQISIMAMNFLSGFVSLMSHVILMRMKETEHIDAFLVNIFRIFPSYNVGEGMLGIAANYYYNTLLERNVSAFAWHVTGRNIAIMCLQGFIFFSLVLLSESECWFIMKRNYETYQLSRLRLATSLTSTSVSDDNEDIDVAHERVAVEQASKGHVAVLLRGIHKVYALPWTTAHYIEYLLDTVRCVFGQPVTESYRLHYKHAVKDFNLCVPVGECFGLLGVNGAGKTTSMNILTGDAIQSSGEAFICGQPLHNFNTKYFVGYCPQVDPLLELMTARELLTFYGRIRGDVGEEDLQARVAELIETVGLSPHAHKPCGVYSGGNKRKLSLAIALIGNPPVLFLDEPSTGMDPVARRKMWDVISKVAATKSTILTTHSMEECEALCTRIGIMVGGSLKCIGAAQHLKSKFGSGYLIEGRISSSKKHDISNQIEEIIKRLKECRVQDVSSFSEITRRLLSSSLDITIEDQHSAFFKLSVMGADFSPGKAFTLLEKLKSKERVLNSYSMTQSSLEHVFIKMASADLQEGSTDDAIKHHHDLEKEKTVQKLAIEEESSAKIIEIVDEPEDV